jgi:hypothetical protein
MNPGIKNLLPAIALFGALAAIDPIAAQSVGFVSPGNLTTTSSQPANLGAVFTANSNFSVVALGVYNIPGILSETVLNLRVPQAVHTPSVIS